MAMEIRKIFTVVEETMSDMGRKADGKTLRKVGVVAVIKNPYAGKYQEDLSLLIEESVEIGTMIAAKAKQALGDDVESYGKAVVVGTNGEQEQGVAMVTTVFGNAFRDAIGGGKAWISSATKRAAAGATIDVPLAFKDALFVRSHYDAMTLTLHDAPLPDEIAVICCVANRGRLNARVGGLKASEAKKQDGLV